MKIVIGEFVECNQFRKQEMKKSYYKQYVKEFASVNYFFSWAKGAGKPVLGNNYLVFIHDRDTYIRNPSKFIRDIQNIEKIKPYIDVVWQTPRMGQLRNIAVSEEIINLNKLYREDFKTTLTEDMPNLNDRGFKALFKAIGFSWKTYEVYRDDLKQANPITDKDIRKIINVGRIPAANEVISKIVFRQYRAINEYTKLCNKYSERWMKEHMQKELDSIIDLKLKLTNREISYMKITSDKDKVKYLKIITDAPIVDVFLLRHMVAETLGVQLYLSLNSQQLVIHLDNYLKEGRYRIGNGKFGQRHYIKDFK